MTLRLAMNAFVQRSYSIRCRFAVTLLHCHWCENESDISINAYKTELNSLQIKSFVKFSQLIKTNAPF